MSYFLAANRDMSEFVKRIPRRYGYPPDKQVKATQTTLEQVEVEECFHQALDIARQQNARSWELRAVISLSRLWQGQGKKEQARQMLTKIYDCFTEGFDTTDLKEARAMLEELSR